MMKLARIGCDRFHSKKLLSAYTCHQLKLSCIPYPQGALMPDKSWYFSRKGRVEGPFTLAQLNEVITEPSEYMVWNPSLSEWQRADKTMSNSTKNKVEAINPAGQRTIERFNAHQQSDRTSKAYAKVIASKKLKDFAGLWLKLEEKHAKEKQALLKQVVQNEERLMKLAQQELEQVGQRKNALKETLARLESKSKLQASADQTLTRSLTESRQEPRLIDSSSYEHSHSKPSIKSGLSRDKTLNDSQKATTQHDAHQAASQLKERLKQVEESRKKSTTNHATQKVQRSKAPSQSSDSISRSSAALKEAEQAKQKIEQLQSSLKQWSNPVQTSPSAESTDDDMMRRVSRRRRRRFR